MKDLLADYNDIVRKGQVLARLEPSLLQAQVDQAEASLLKSDADVERLRVALDSAGITLARATTLAARNLIAANELDAATIAVKSAEAGLKSGRAQVTEAQASLNQARVTLGHTVITAPIGSAPLI